MNTVRNKARPTARYFLLSLGLRELQIVGHLPDQFAHRPGMPGRVAQDRKHELIV